jgi:hypothetical protein
MQQGYQFRIYTLLVIVQISFPSCVQLANKIG